VRSPQGEGTEAAARAQFMIGETYFHQRNYATALREFLRVEILYDYPAWQAASLLEAAKCHEQLEQWRPAVELYDRLLTDFPETELRDEAARRLQAARVRLAAAR
jgi:TolA-binding protein